MHVEDLAERPPFRKLAQETPFEVGAAKLQSCFEQSARFAFIGNGRRGRCGRGHSGVNCQVKILFWQCPPSPFEAFREFPFDAWKSLGSARIQSTSIPALTWSCARMKNE